MNTIVKLYFVLTVFLIACSPSGAQPAAQVISRKVLFEIGKGEMPVFNKSSIVISPIGSSVTVLTSDDEGRIYVYENGQKRGPFDDIRNTRVSIPEDDPGEFDPIYRRESDQDYEKYALKDDAGQVSINFGGKSFGPFQFILEFYATKDKTAFYSVVMKDSKPLVISSSGNSFSLDGQPGYSHISPSGKKMIVSTVKENNETGELLNRDLSGLSAEEINKLKKEIEAKQKNKPPDAYVYLQDGTKFGPYNPRKISADNPAFIKTGGDNWLLTMDSRLYINGKAVRDLPNDQISPSNIWITEDGKRYVIVFINRIEFSDGQVFKDPLKIRILNNQNKTTLWWLSFENEKDIVLYARNLQ